MKQELISAGLAVADFIHRHPKRITAVIGAVLLNTDDNVDVGPLSTGVRHL